jgi:hypothetical protein
VLKFCLPLALGAALAAGQQPKQTPPVRVNVLNVCAPSADEQKEISAALARVPPRPAFAPDFEITRGHTTMADAPSSNWVRLRREYPKSAPLLAAQFVFSVDSVGNKESLVFYSREAKDVMQISLEDEVAAGTPPGSVVGADTPVSHIRLQRFGKPSLVLARCPNVNQSAQEPLFRTASQLMAAYRAAMNARQIVPAELQRLANAGDHDGRRPPKVKHMEKR